MTTDTSRRDAAWRDVSEIVELIDGLQFTTHQTAALMAAIATHTPAWRSDLPSDPITPPPDLVLRLEQLTRQVSNVTARVDRLYLMLLAVRNELDV